MNTPLVISLIPDLSCIAVCGAATVIDTRHRRIPNRLTFPAFGIAVSMNWLLVSMDRGAVGGITEGLVPALIGAALLFFSFLAFNAAKGVGMGDVKLMAAVGAFLRWPLALWTLAFVLFAGALLSFVYAMRSGALRDVFRNMALGAATLIGKKNAAPPLSLHYMPYAAAILLGVIGAVMFRYYPLITAFF